MLKLPVDYKWKYLEDEVHGEPTQQERVEHDYNKSEHGQPQ